MIRLKVTAGLASMPRPPWATQALHGQPTEAVPSARKGLGSPCCGVGSRPQAWYMPRVAGVRALTRFPMSRLRSSLGRPGRVPGTENKLRVVAAEAEPRQRPHSHQRPLNVYVPAASTPGGRAASQQRVSRRFQKNSRVRTAWTSGLG